ncbi:uncharacterized protein FTOL_13989 [Fusarium torulosum]|uniref:Uncharacterized protein n=1 Tax=Fusarium torulosum TaxID=33205 RepID=A0AAE8MN51_9HYPO|nr:uncharacterized protein FTOL_13989 [Fusarium torulosum]
MYKTSLISYRGRGGL